MLESELKEALDNTAEVVQGLPFSHWVCLLEGLLQRLKWQLSKKAAFEVLT